MASGVFYFQKDSLLLPAGISPSAANIKLSPEYTANFPFSDVFSIPTLAGDGKISCVSVSPDTILPPDWQAIPMRQVFTLLPASLSDETGQTARVLRAFHIAQWRRESRFCGSCGSKNTDSHDELARHCPACGRTEYPRIAPAIITVILNGEGKILLARNKKFVTGTYSLIAGFVEAGESLEAAVKRETLEEVGIEVRDVQYLVSQPWPFPNSLMMGFLARHAGGEIQPDGVEIDDARWFGKDDIPRLPGPGSVARYLVERWLNGEIRQ